MLARSKAKMIDTNAGDGGSLILEKINQNQDQDQKQIWQSQNQNHQHQKQIYQNQNQNQDKDQKQIWQNQNQNHQNQKKLKCGGPILALLFLVAALTLGPSAGQARAYYLTGPGLDQEKYQKYHYYRNNNNNNNNENNNNNNANRIRFMQKRLSDDEEPKQKKQKCDIFANEPLHAIMDRVCQMCHEMFSHEKPNMRSDCRSKCFENENFKMCLQLFRPAVGELPLSPVRRMVRNESVQGWKKKK